MTNNDSDGTLKIRTANGVDVTLFWCWCDEEGAGASPDSGELKINLFNDSREIAAVYLPEIHDGRKLLAKVIEGIKKSDDPFHLFLDSDKWEIEYGCDDASEINGEREANTSDEVEPWY